MLATKRKTVQERKLGYMIKNKIVALVFRIVAFIVISVGLARQFGFFNGIVYLESLKYYTILSNILALTMFAVLLPPTVNGLRGGHRGCAAYFTRFCMVCSVNLLLTFFVFWALLAPNVPAFYLVSLDNILIHVFAPLACLLDYILFSETGKIRYKDVYSTLIFPYIYSASAIIAGYLGYNYGLRFVVTEYLSADSVEGYIVPKRAPYFFLDFDEIGLHVLLYAAGIIAFILLIAHVFYILDYKLYKRSTELAQQNETIEVIKSTRARFFSHKATIAIIAILPALLVSLSIMFGDRIAKENVYGMWWVNDLLKFNVEVIDERVFFIVDDSAIDISDYCSETTYFEHEYFTENDYRQVIVVGGTLDNLGWIEFVWDNNGNLVSQVTTFFSPDDVFKSWEWRIIAEALLTP